MPCAGRYVTALLMRRNVSRIGLRELKWMQTTNKHYYWELRKQSKWQQNNSNRSRSQSDPHKRCERMPTKRERTKAEKFINLLCVLALTDIKRNRLWTDKPPERHNCCRYRFGRRLPFAVRRSPLSSSLSLSAVVVFGFCVRQYMALGGIQQIVDANSLKSAYRHLTPILLCALAIRLFSYSTSQSIWFMSSTVTYS